MRTSGFSLLLCAAAIPALSGTSRGQCLELEPGFRLPGPSDAVLALATLDIGSGQALYGGGKFIDVEGAPAGHVARWDGSSWNALGGGVDGDVLAISALTNGSGSAIYVGGAFSNAGGAPASHIARWNGTTWSPLGSGVDGAVKAMAVFDDGSGPALFVGGAFTHAGGAAAAHLAKWNGSTWSGVGGGVDGEVTALAVHDDGSGTSLFAGGSFAAAGGMAASNVARWNGSIWSATGAGLGCAVSALSVFDPGTGPVLCSAGCDVQAWDGASWTALGPGGPGFSFALQAFDDGTGPALYAGGFSGSPAVLTKWDGTTWSVPSQGPWNGKVSALAVFDDGNGAALHAGGDVFFQPLALPLFLARRLAGTWIPVGDGLGTNAGVEAIASFDDGTGEAIYAAGRFTSAGAARADRIARFEGDRWTPLAGGGIGDDSTAGDVVRTMTAFDDGQGSALFVGGSFSTAGGVPANHVARWNGSGWSALDTGLGGGSGAEARSMAVFDDGSGPALYVGGDFTAAGGIAVRNVAKWDGSNWSDVGGGTDGPVNRLLVFDDGSGPALFAGGEFTEAGSVSASNIAKWQGNAWIALDEGVPTGVLSMAAFDDGHGPGLFVGVTGLTTLPKWDGADWISTGNGDLSCGVTAMIAFDAGDGPALYLSVTPCFKGPPTIMRWDGQDLVAITEAPAIDNTRAMFVRAGSGSVEPQLWLGFELPASRRNQLASGLAAYSGCGPGGPICFGDGTEAPCPCNNSGLSGHGCANSTNPDGALLACSGTSSLSADSVVFTATGVRPTGLSIFLQGDARSPATRYGDGLTCIGGGHLRRLYKRMAVGGTVLAPIGAELPPSACSSARGDPILPGTVRYYSVVFRDATSSFCPHPAGGFLNSTNALRVYWHP